MDMHGIATLTSLVSSTVNAAKNALDLSSKSGDRELKRELSNTLNGLNEIHATVMSLQQDNQDLRNQLRSRATVRRSPEFGYYFAEGDSDPLCPRCYEKDEKRIHLSKPEAGDLGGMSRLCGVCCFEIVEQRGAPRANTSNYDPY